MPYYLAPYVGSGVKGDPYRPRGADGQEFSSLDLRPGRDVALLWTPAPVTDAQLITLGDDAIESVTDGIRNRLTTAMGRTVTGATVQEVVVGLATAITANGADRTGRVRVYLGPLVSEITPIQGGAALDDEEHMYVWWRSLGASLADARWLAAHHVWPIGGGAALATDNFNRADEVPIAGNWTDLGEVDQLYLGANTVLPESESQDASVYYNAVSFPNDQYSQANITSTNSAGDGAGMGVGVRANTPGASRNYYRLVIDAVASLNIELAKRVSGTYTRLWIRTQSWSAGALIYLGVQGTTLVAKVAGTAVGASQSDSAIATGSGSLVHSSTTTGATADNWEGGDVGAGPAAGVRFEGWAGVIR